MFTALSTIKWARVCESRARLLALLVNSALRNAPVAEKDILAALFPAKHYAPGTTAARTNASYMRGLVDQYYKTLGKDDLVIIQFPKDPGTVAKKRTANYRPSISYHPDHLVVKAYQNGIHHLHQKHPLALERSLRFFDEALKSQPNRVDINIAMAESLVGLALLSHATATYYGAAGEYAFKAVQLARDDWHALAALGRSI